VTPEAFKLALKPLILFVKHAPLMKKLPLNVLNLSTLALGYALQFFLARHEI